MIDAKQELKNQIHRCDKLLHVYHNEHRILLTKTRLAMCDLLPILQLKQRMVEAVGQQQKVLAKANACPHPPSTDTVYRDLLGDLADRLERLLVIDQENETLLRRLLEANKSSTIERLHQANSSRTQNASPSPPRRMRIQPFQPQRLATRLDAKPRCAPKPQRPSHPAQDPNDAPAHYT